MIIESYLSGYGANQISAMLNLKYSTVYTIIGVYRKEDKIEQKVKFGQRKKKLSKTHVNR